MSDFLPLMGYEFKKILRGRGVKLTLLACAGLLLAISALEYVAISPEDQRVYAREQAIEGRALDEDFVAGIAREAEAAGGLDKIEKRSSHYHAARFLMRMLGDYMNIDGITGRYRDAELTAETVYATRQEILDYLYDFFRLTDAEKAWWAKREARVAKPFTWRAHYGLSAMRANSYTCLAMFCMLAGVCLSGSFAMERAGRTDALILASKRGRGLWLHKFAAGELFALMSGLLLLLSAQLPNVVFNGFHGLDGAWQLLVPLSSYPCTAGEMLARYLGLYVLACLCVGAFAMLMSVTLQSMAAAAGVVFALVLLDLFLAVPAGFRAVAQLRALSPLQMFNNAGLTDPRLLRIAGRWLTPLQVAGIAYPVVIAGCLVGVRGRWGR